MNYKAVEVYFDANGIKQEHLCAFGFCDTLEDQKRRFMPDVQLFEISDEELEELKAAYEQKYGENIWGF
jgi:hypothetical protein